MRRAATVLTIVAAPGRYVARLLTDDGYAVLAQRTFTVVPRR